MAGVPITLTDVSSGYNLTALNANFDAIAAAFALALYRNSATGNAMGSNLDMNGYSIVNVAGISSGAGGVIDVDERFLVPAASDPTTRDDASALQAGDIYFNTTSSVLKFYNGSAWIEFPSSSGETIYWVGNFAGSANSISATPGVFTAYTDGMMIAGRLIADQSSTTYQINIDSLGVKTVYLEGTTVPPVGSLKNNGHYIFQYDADAGAFHLLNPTISTSSFASASSEQQWTRVQRAGQESVSYAASWSPNLNNAPDKQVGALTGGITIGLPTNCEVGDLFSIKLVQDATGSRAITMNAGYINQPSSFVTAASKRMWIECKVTAQTAGTATEVLVLGSIIEA